MNKQELKQLNEELDYILEDLDTIQQKYYFDIDKRAFNRVLTMDPTYNQRSDKLGSYGKWLLSMYKKDNDILNEHEKIFDTLQFYDKNKRHFKSNDIFQYKTVQELFKEFNQLKDTIQLSKSQLKKEISKIDIEASDEIDKIYEDDEWVLYVPKTYKASIKLGRGTEWCTASSNSKYYFNHYAKDDPLIVCINKNTDEKYQYHEDSDQFKDIQDHEVDRNILNEDVWDFLKDLTRNDLGEDLSDYKHRYFQWRKENNPLLKYKDKLYDIAKEQVLNDSSDLIEGCYFDNVDLNDIAVKLGYRIYTSYNEPEPALVIDVKGRPNITNEKLLEIISNIGDNFIDDEISFFADTLKDEYYEFTIRGRSGGYWGLSNPENNLELTDEAVEKLTNIYVETLLDDFIADSINEIDWSEFYADYYDKFRNSIVVSDVRFCDDYIKQMKELERAIDSEEEYINSDEFIDITFTQEQLDEIFSSLV